MNTIMEKAMNPIVTTRPARPELLTPVPFVAPAPEPIGLNGSTDYQLGLLLLLALVYFLPLGLMEHFGGTPFKELALQLLITGLAAQALAKIGTNWRLKAGDGLRTLRGVPVVLWQSPLSLIGEGLFIFLITLPPAVALVYETIHIHLLHPQAYRLVPVWDMGAVLVLLVWLGTTLTDLGRRWRAQRLNRQAPADPPPPPRGPARHSAHFFTDAPVALTLRTALAIDMLLVALDGGQLALLFVAGALADFFFIYRRRWGYRASDDCFYWEEWRGGRWEERQRWPAADFIGLYVLKDSSPQNRDAQLWLAGPAGSRDVPMATLEHWGRNNGRAAQRLAAQLSRVSGLPVLYRLKEVE